PETGRVRAMLAGGHLHVGPLEFAPDGTRLISRCFDVATSRHLHEVLLWDLVSPRRLARVEGLAGRIVEDLRFSAGIHHFWEVSRGVGGPVQLGLWDVATNPAQPQLEWRRDTSLNVVPMTRDGTIVALPEEGNRFLLYNCLTGMDLRRIGPLDKAYDF